MTVPVDAMPLTALVELVNEWGTTPRREAGEQDQPFPPPSSLDGRLGIPATAVPTDDALLLAAADAVYPVFATDALAQRAAQVNQLLALTGVRPTLRDERGELHAAWQVDDPRRAVVAAAAVALRTYLAEHPASRLGTCTGRRCADVYVDTSPTGQRRYCSVTCQNRARVAAYRSRRAGSRQS